jgi:hypothetical protein
MGPKAAAEKPEGTEARRAAKRPKPQEGTGAFEKAAGAKVSAWRITRKRRKSLGENEKGDIYTNHVTRSDRETEATGTSKRTTSLRQPRSVNRSEQPERPGRPEARKLNYSSLKGCVAQ